MCVIFRRPRRDQRTALLAMYIPAAPVSLVDFLASRRNQVLVHDFSAEKQPFAPVFNGGKPFIGPAELLHLFTGEALECGGLSGKQNERHKPALRIGQLERGDRRQVWFI